MKSTSPRRNTISTEPKALPTPQRPLSEQNGTPVSRQNKSVSFDHAVRPAIATRPATYNSPASSDIENHPGLPVLRNFSPRPGKENYVFQVPDAFLQAKPELSTQPPARLANDTFYAAPRSPRLIVRTRPLPLTSQSAPISMSSSPVTTPRITGGHMQKENSLNKIGRQLSNTLGSISPRLKSSFSNAFIGSASPAKDTTNPFQSLSEELLDKLEQNVLELKNNPEFQLKPAYQKNIILHAEIMQHLPAENEFRDTDKLKLLLAELNERIANTEHGIHTEVDLNDPAFSGFISSAAYAAFIKTWEQDHSDVQNDLRHYLSDVKPTFARDFENSHYFFKDADGSLKRLSSIEEFVALTKSASHADLPKIISNIASQNLGNFMKNALFLRHDTNGNSQSILKRRNGTPVMPLATVSASYVFRKNTDGSISIDYNWSSSKSINGAKEMRAREMTGNFPTFAVKNAALDIRVTIKIQPDGQWQIFNPHIKANGWT